MDGRVKTGLCYEEGRRIAIHSIACSGDALHAGPSDTLFEFDFAVHRRRRV